ncbi:unnamed protein product [Owenia fusiformis]|uniref:Uncharacterized protein n=1 Tax=Owenia fusiformis TaxID=6347 RepID=A0A8J1UWT8_OWEFU|nr:unnamed protein product [Owenia fusiformis]
MEILVFLVYFAIMLVYLVGMYGYLILIDMPGSKTYGGPWKFLTFLDLCFQTFYYSLCVINHMTGGTSGPGDKRSRSSLQKFRDLFHACVAYPMGTFVVITFWGIYAVDRELVYPTHLDKIIPVWLNHVMHTTILPILLIEKYLVYHEYPTFKKGVTITAGVGLTYLTWVFWIAFYKNFWVYPVLEVLSWGGRLAFIGGLLVMLIFIYSSGQAFTNKIWNVSKQRPSKQRQFQKQS